MIQPAEPSAEGPGASETPAAGSERQLFLANRQLLQGELRAPVPLHPNPKRVFQGLLRQLFELHGLGREHAELVEPAAICAGSILYGCQELVLGCHALLSARDVAVMQAACRAILSSARELSGNRGGSYASAQAAGLIAPALDREGEAAQAPLGSRRKRLGDLLEDYFLFERPIEVGMPLELLGRLQVHLEELYDVCCRALERFYLAVQRSPQPGPLALALTSLHELIVNEVDDHVVAQAIAPPEERDRSASEAGADERRGLLQLLPELAESARTPENREEGVGNREWDED